MLRVRVEASIIFYKQKFFFCGGLENYHTIVSSVLEYQVDANEMVEHCNTVLSFRHGHTAVLYQNEMIVYGGCDEHCSMVYAMNLDTLEWRILPVSSKGYQPAPRQNHAAVVVAHCMFVSGGNLSFTIDKEEPNSVLFYLDLQTCVWHKIDTIFPAIWRHSMHVRRCTNLQQELLLLMKDDDSRMQCPSITRIALFTNSLFLNVPPKLFDVQFNL